MSNETDKQTIDLFADVPGIGPGLAGRIVEQLGIETLAELRAAAEDGRLQQVNGIGKGRAEQVAAALAEMDLSTPAPETAVSETKEPSTPEMDSAPPATDVSVPELPTEPPSVELLLSLDAAYRQQAAAGELQEVDAPRRTGGNDTLPVLRQERGPWTFTVYFSTTVRARQHDKTDDWVLISYQHQGDPRRHTIVTETEGPLAKKRVIRGLEEACADHYGISL